jgi:Zn-dependent M28 family amino/carboxypeptidase
MATTVAAQPASAVDQVNTAKLRKAVTVGGILSHERVLQRIANQNGGTRASGTPGFTASATYVKKTLREAGYTVKEQKFTFPFWRDLADPTLAQVPPTATDYDTESFTYSASGEVTGTVVPTNDIVIPPSATPSSTSGCEAADFAPASPTQPQVALIQRGTCTFQVKAENAVAAGYDAVLIFNEGQAGRTELLAGTLGVPLSIPVLGLDFAQGAALYSATQAGSVTVALTSSTETNLTATTSNIIAETPKGDPNKVLVVGAHLDSVAAGPGINDNGSGTATLLEVAQQLSELKIKPRQKVRFIFFGAEEFGLLGSVHYVETLTDRQLGRIFANLNFDMLGSPNYVRFVYDGDGSAFDEAGPPGSADIESIFTGYLDSQGLASAPTAFDGRSDYGPFIEAGIPAGGLFSGAEGLKTQSEADVYGGTAGQAYDSCYHQACDTIGNLSTKALNELGDAAAHAILTLAASKTGLYVDGSFRAAGASARADAAPAAAGKAQYRGHLAVS